VVLAAGRLHTYLRALDREIERRQRERHQPAGAAPARWTPPSHPRAPVMRPAFAPSAL
jgi:hypothetical protein